jgi:hypothetical protein
MRSPADLLSKVVKREQRISHFRFEISKRPEPFLTTDSEPEWPTG